MNQSTPSAGGTGFFGWLRGLGITRSAGDRWFAGVAGGIAARAGIDPLIVRGVFVVLAILGGPGVVLYLAGWLLLPAADGSIHLEELFRGRASAGVVIAAVVIGLLVVIPTVIGVLSAVFGGPARWGMWDVFGVPDWVQVTLSILWWAVLLPAGIIWLIVWISRGGLRTTGSTGTTSDPTGSTAASGATDWTQKLSADASAWGQKVGEDAAAWGQKVGEDTSAWAERERLKYEARRLGAGHVIVTLALALLAGGGTAAWALAIDAEPRFVFTIGVVAAVAVCALSMIVAGIRGKTSGWIGFTAFVGAIALIFTPFTSLMPDDLTVRPLGDVSVRVTDATPRESGLAVFTGNADLDLTALDARDAGRTVEVWMFAGNIDIELPRDHPTRVTVDVFAGNTAETSIDGEIRTVRGPFLSRTTGVGLDGAAPADITEVQVRLFAGNVEIDGTAAESEVTR